MADEDFQDYAMRESNGHQISRSLNSSRSGRAGISQEFRDRQQDSREHDSAWRKDIEERKFDVQKMASQAARDAASLKAAEVKFNLLSKMTTIQEGRQVLDHSIKAMEEFNGLDYKDGATPNRIADIYRRNPRAFDNPRVASFADKLIGMHETYLKDFRADSQATAKKAEIDKASTGLEITQTVDDGITRKQPGDSPLTPEQKLAAQRKEIVSGALTFGHMKGGEITPDAGGQKATHVSSFYADPFTGKMERTPAMTIAEFQEFEKRAKASPKSGAPAVATGTGAPAPAAPAIVAPAQPVTAPAAAPTTVWKVKDGVKWEFDAETKKPTGKYVQSK